MYRINKILAPTDCSEPSTDALIYAAQFADTFKADLTVLKVFTSPTERYEEGILIRDYSLEITPAHIGELELFWNDYTGSSTPPEFAGVMGDPFDEIIRYSQEHTIDMIIMGTHGYTGFKHILMGSVAEKVVRYSKIPVLTVKQKNFEYRPADDTGD